MVEVSHLPIRPRAPLEWLPGSEREWLEPLGALFLIVDGLFVALYLWTALEPPLDAGIR